VSEAAPWSRDDLIGWLRLRHVAEAFVVLRFDLPPGTRWEGDGERGAFRLANGSGDDAAAVWEPGGLVAVAFDHESERSAIGGDADEPEAWDPRACFAPPAALDDLLARAVRLLEEGDQNVTAGVWAEGEAVRASEPYAEAAANGIDLIEPEAEPLPCLTRSLSLDEPVARLAVALAARAAAGPTELAPPELAVLEASPRRAGGPAEARALLAQLRVAWPE